MAASTSIGIEVNDSDNLHESSKICQQIKEPISFIFEQLKYILEIIIFGQNMSSNSGLLPSDYFFFLNRPLDYSSAYMNDQRQAYIANQFLMSYCNYIQIYTIWTNDFFYERLLMVLEYLPNTQLQC